MGDAELLQELHEGDVAQEPLVLSRGLDLTHRHQAPHLTRRLGSLNVTSRVEEMVSAAVIQAGEERITLQLLHATPRNASEIA